MQSKFLWPYSSQTHKEVDLLSFSFLFCRWRRRYINYAKKANKTKAITSTTTTTTAAQSVTNLALASALAEELTDQVELSHNSADTRKKPLKAQERLPHTEARNVRSSCIALPSLLHSLSLQCSPSLFSPAPFFSPTRSRTPHLSDVQSF